MIDKTYSVNEIFSKDPDNPDNELMKIPDEIATQMGWEPGDVLKINVLETGVLSITKVNDE